MSTHQCILELQQRVGEAIIGQAFVIERLLSCGSHEDSRAEVNASPDKATKAFATPAGKDHDVARPFVFRPKVKIKP